MSGSGEWAEAWSCTPVSRSHPPVPTRNYLDHVAGTISDWTREEELKREAAKARSRDRAELPGSRTPEADWCFEGRKPEL